MYISLADNSTPGFKKWSDARPPPGNDDIDDSGGATPLALAKPLCDDRATPEEPPHRPWLVAGVGASL